MKLDFKSIIILALLGFSLFFFYKWYFTGSDSYKKDLDRLRKENEIIKNKRDSIYKHLNKLQLDFKTLEATDSLLRNKIAETENDIKVAKNKANLSKAELEHLRVELEKTRKKIEELQTNPANRSGEDLLNSLKNKTKR